MLWTCGAHGPLVKISSSAFSPGDRRRLLKWWNRGVPMRSVAVGARLSSFLSSPIGLDSQSFHTNDLSQLLWVGPVPGDIAEVEAYCRIFRASEQLHTVLMETLCNPETGECAVSYDTTSEDMTLLEDKVVAVIGCMVALLNRGREDVLSGRSSFANSFQIADVNLVDGKLPPLAIFRNEMKRCCESLQVALSSYLPPFEDRSISIWRRLQRLKNVCYDAGFSRGDAYPCPTLFANWGPVYFSSKKQETALGDHEVAFWRGGQVTDEGLNWLIEKGFKTIVDIREDAVKDEYYGHAVEQAVSCGKIVVLNLPVEIGVAPSREQVEKFASLVSDPNRRPLYLQGQEGVNRPSAMVSRWRQFITRSSMRSISNGPLSSDGKPSNTGKSAEQPSLHNLLSLEPKGGILLDEEVESTSKLDSTNDLSITCKQQESSVENGHYNGKVAHELAVDSTSSHGAAGSLVESLANISLESNPLKAQLPTCDFFSRKEMRIFFKSKTISPKSYVRPLQKKFEMLPNSCSTQSLPVQNNETVDPQLSERILQENSNGISSGRQVISKTDAANVSNGKHLDRRSSAAFGASVNGFHQMKSCTITIEPSEQALSSSIAKNERTNDKFSTGSVKDLDVVEGDMCASATGVVRVQSRKKAEMFLVRTDGFSCTREKVTESSLAFTHPSTQQQMLMWKSPPKTVLLLKKLGEELMEEAKEVATFLHYQENMNVLVEPDVHDILARIPGFGFVQTFYSQDTSDLHERVDLVTCLGGDGVILHASNLFRGAVPPVVSFNLGSLGFLTSHTFEEYKRDLRAVIHGNNTVDGVYITLRMRLRCEVFRNGRPMPGKVFDVLNEIVVDRGSNPYLSKIECYEHDRLITKVQGDGVIVATPTGSTAYSTAAGGSMVHPNVPCMLFTPICPHSLSFRPVILPDSARLELKIPSDTRNNAWVSFDGKRRQQLSRGDSVRISMSQHPLPTVNKCDQTGDWFRSLIRCLNWNERLDQKAL
ncbi:uncharacterized protein A4U43_C09F2250 [Asparagus officinalis]|uniref:NAD(+) kinase n=1 Tax=Asparagus officinalis TaxID=4686 RepID=A0A5P1E4X3_ASPOF|nr:probable NAD kinase 2, chloroplastic [Asparagus officinalis]XP_020246033.1 probable NAD kinase 2, chloroplastic [Asparagus officinalis]XP_020246034.1 probable NAD kinase 2, chloroplastic [Asparagus officinalis]ONK57610.1 uncharacterized protein A4U43_C09F2250 [Asparagus officinalis]